MEKERMKNNQMKKSQSDQAWQQGYAHSTLLGMAATEPSPDAMRWMRWIAEHHVPSVRGKHALDIGCGKGRNALFLARQGYDVAAFDLVKEAVEVLQARAQSAGLPVTAWVGDLTRPWPIPAHSIDLVFDDKASMSIGFQEGIRFCYQEMYRVLKPGGYAVVSSLHEHDPFLAQFPAGEEPHTIVTPYGKIATLTTPERLRRE
jgi:SAM-dependent methyltransferase